MKSTASATIVIRPGTASKRAARGNRKRHYVSGATQGAIATFVDAKSVTTYQGYTLQANAVATAASPATCGSVVDGAYTCTLYFVLDPSASPYQTTVTTYDMAQSGTSAATVSASSTSPAVAISTGTQSLAIVANQDNPFSFTLQGVVESFDVTPQYIGVNGAVASMASPAPTFQALDGDALAIDTEDTTSDFAVGMQPSGPFTEDASFAVNALDENTCLSGPCLTTTATAVTNPSSESAPYAYNGQGSGGDGVSTPPYYGAIALTSPATYSGPAVTVGSSSYAAAAYVVPFFGFVDSTSPYASGSSGVSFVAPSNTITLYAAQYHLPDNATGYAADTSACGSGSSAIATASGPTLNSGYGASFVLSAGTVSGTCNVVLSDGAGDSATIAVTSTAGGNSTITVPCGAPTGAPNSRSRHAAAAAPCPQHTANLYSSNGGVQCETDSSTVASFGYPARGSVTTTDLANGTVLAKFTYTGGDPISTYTANITCVGAIGTFTTDVNGNATATFTLPSNFTTGSMAGFDAGNANNNNGITGVFAI